ncbi:MAG: DUF6745 domain-containing protein [Cyanobacteria bacterium P01_G01_bin.67]
MPKITNLTAEQDALIPIYQQKWQKIATSTVTIDRQKAIAAINRVYSSMGKSQPAVQFFASPNQVKNELITRPPEILAKQLGVPVLKLPSSLEILVDIQKQIDSNLWAKLSAELQPRWQPLTFFLQQLGASAQSDIETRRWTELWQQLSEQQWENRWSESERWVRSQVKQFPGGDILLGVGDQVWSNFGQSAWQQIGEPLANEINKQPWMQDFEETLKQFSLPWLQMGNVLGLSSSVFNGFESNFIALIDYCIDVLNCQYDPEKWLATSSLVQDCGWVFFFDRTCLVCDRPNQILFNEQYQLHGEGEAAIAYKDGYSVYAYNGVILPEKYGRLHPHQWQASWLLTEPNAELRKVLIQGIGYGRICQELQATEIDSWREYTLLKIDNNIDVEPIHLLKMVCPSTNHIHATRIPPHIRSAKEAITWMNWDTDPEEFAVET